MKKIYFPHATAMFMLLCFALAFPINLNAQARLIINNGPYIVMNGGTSSTPIYLVVANGNSNAIVRNTSGHIVTESEFNILRWNIGTNTGTYVAPFGRASSLSDYVPLEFTISAAGAGGTGFDLNTYRTTTWDNDAYKPTSPSGMHMYLDGTTSNNSAKVLDRFYQISTNGRGYTTQPTLNNIVLAYLDVEHTAAGNSITESNLGAQYWQNTAPIGWHTNTTLGTINTTTNRATVSSSIPSLTNVRWWVLTDKSSPLPVTLADFSVKCVNNKPVIKFTTSSEINNDYFELMLVSDGQEISLTKIPGKGNSTSNQNYQYTHNNVLPKDGLLYLHQYDFDGSKTTYGPYSYTHCADGGSSTLINAFPNPTQGDVTIKFTGGQDEDFTIQFYNAIGQVIQTEQFAYNVDDHTLYELKTDGLSQGVYFISIMGNRGTNQVLKFRKIDP